MKHLPGFLAAPVFFHESCDPCLINFKSIFIMYLISTCLHNITVLSEKSLGREFSTSNALSKFYEATGRPAEGQHLKHCDPTASNANARFSKLQTSVQSDWIMKVCFPHFHDAFLPHFLASCSQGWLSNLAPTGESGHLVTSVPCFLWLLRFNCAWGGRGAICRVGIWIFLETANKIGYFK